MEIAPDSPLNSSKLDCTPVSPFSSHGSNGIFSPEKVAQFGTSRTTVCDPPGPIHPTALEPTVDPRARASKSDFHEFSHAYPPGRPPSTNSTIEILRLDHESSKQALNAKLAERHGEVENISDEFTLATPDQLEKIMSRLRLSQTTARQETQLNFKPSYNSAHQGLTASCKAAPPPPFRRTARFHRSMICQPSKHRSGRCMHTRPCTYALA
jgi:hypothetical protein